jgi:hypothetical protein
MPFTMTAAAAVSIRPREAVSTPRGVPVECHCIGTIVIGAGELRGQAGDVVEVPKDRLGWSQGVDQALERVGVLDRRDDVGGPRRVGVTSELACPVGRPERMTPFPSLIDPSSATIS